MKKLVLLFAASAFIVGCGKSTGEKLGEEVCDCYTKAGNDFAATANCLNLQLEKQKEIQGDLGNTSDYLKKLSSCPFIKK